MTVARNDLIEALRVRYDHHSAFAVFEMSRQRAALADKDRYERAELEAFRAALVAVGDRVQSVLARIDHWLDAAPASTAAEPAKGQGTDKGAKTHAGKAEPAKTEAAKAEPVKAEPAKAEPVKAEPAKAELAKAEVAKAEPVTADPVATDASGTSAATIATTISLTGVDVKDGDQLVVCGAGALGDWDPAKGMTMTKQGDAWIATIELPPDAELAFKFLRRTASGNVIWEPGDNRSLVAKSRIDATWR